MAMSIGGTFTELDYCCGITEFGEFELGNDGDWYFDGLDYVRLGQSGLACAAFINNLECRTAYENLKDRFNIVFQSTVRKNKGSGNELFFVVYDGERGI